MTPAKPNPLAKLRSGRQSDVEACVDILRNWAADTPWMAQLDDLEPLRDFWRHRFEIDHTWVAEADGRIVGFCTRDDDNIGALYVVPERRSTGIGKGLLDLAKAGCDWITVWAYELNPEARRFYAREGLVYVGKEIEDDSGLMNFEHRWFKAK